MNLTREQVAAKFECSYTELGRLLRERYAPLPVKIDGNILWHDDEVTQAEPDVKKLLARRRASFQNRK
jgi:hypothetical protein